MNPSDWTTPYRDVKVGDPLPPLLAVTAVALIRLYIQVAASQQYTKAVLEPVVRLLVSYFSHGDTGNERRMNHASLAPRGGYCICPGDDTAQYFINT